MTTVASSKQPRSASVATLAPATIRASFLRSLLICLTLAAGTSACYWRVQFFPFSTFDDPQYVEHVRIVSGLSWSNVVWAFTNVHFANWHPLTSISFMLDRQLWGANSRPYHLENVALHVASTMLLFLVLQQMTGFTWRSAIVAALFGLHPLRVESVAWVAERKDVLSGFFWIATLGAYTSYARRPTRLRHLFTLLLFVLGLLSKPMVVTLPVVLFLLDYWPLQRLNFSPNLWRSFTTAPGKSILLEKLPFFFFSLISAVATVLAQKSGGAVASTYAAPIVLRVENTIVSYAAYLWKTLWPINLAALYPLPESYPIWKILLALAVLAACTFAVIRWGGSRRYLVVGWGWYVVTLLPVIGLVQVGSQAMADRYSYIPLIGIVIAVVWAVADFIQTRPSYRLPTVALTIVCALILAQRTYAQTHFWSDSKLLFERVVEVDPNSAVAQYNLGNAYYNQERFDDAIRCYRKSLEIWPDYIDTYNTIGLAYAAKGDTDGAMGAFAEALRLMPDFPAAHNNVASVLIIRKDFVGAEAHLREALRLEPLHWEAHLNLGRVLLVKRQPAEAEYHIREAVKLNSHDSRGHYELAKLLHMKGELAAAMAEYRAAVRENADSPAANNLAWILSTHPDAQYRNGREAVRLAQRLNSLPEKRSEASLDTLAAAYAEAKAFPQAQQTASEALELARKNGRAQLAQEIAGRLELYQQNLPYRDLSLK
ncbi:MAG TPA: tetratricopeptide repeat protein [Tepidisphaeraceae bacterium]|jgi:tetratricopeptide (TPR) repeat protein